jgi:type VI secretion system protein VasJ
LQNLLAAGSFTDLLQGAESAFCDSMFWLTAHRLTASALEALGHEQAKQAVIQALGAFLIRFPEIVNLKFNSGIGFADDMTKSWIEDEVFGGATQSSSGSSSSGSSWDVTTKESMTLAAKGNFQQGLKLLQQGKQTAGDGREKFMWQLACAQYLEKTDHVNMAVSQLEHLWHQLTSHELLEWEAQVSLSVAKILNSCYGNKKFKNEMNDERKGRVGELKSLIYRLDMDAALML